MTKLYFVLLLTVFISCRKKDPIITDPPITTQTISAKVLVYVSDVSGVAISGANVSISSYSGMTDANGLVELVSSSFPAGRVSVNISKSGYYKSNRVIELSDGGKYSVNVSLNTKTILGSFNTSSGGTINSQNGGSIIFSSGNLKDNFGLSYSGVVNVAATYVSSNATNAFQLVPNSFLGLDNNEVETFLENHGVLLIELEGSAGQSLQLASGSTAQLHIPVSAQDIGTAPSSLPLYYFDEATGYWKEDGIATLSGNEYVGTVSHFTFWMCPYVYDHFALQGSVTCGTDGLDGVDISVYNQWGSYLGSTTTNVTGGFSGMIPETITFDLVVSDICGNAVLTTPIGPFNSNTTLNPIDICSSGVSYGLVTGYFTDCNGDIIDDAYCRVESNGLQRFLAPLPSGYINSAVLFCNGSTDAIISGVNLSSGELSQEITMTIAPTMDFDTLQVCNTATEYCQFNLDGTDYFYTANAFAEMDAILDVSGSETFLQVTSGQFMNETHFNVRIPATSIGIFAVGGSPFHYSFVLSGNDGLSNINVTLTSVGTAVGETIEGTIEDVTFNDAGGNPRTLSDCSFKFIIDEVQ